MASRESLRPRSRGSSIFNAKTSLPPVDPSQKPFDAIFNFLPTKIPDKALLKQAILVTTISRPFLLVAVPPQPHHSLPQPSSTSRSDKRRSMPWISSTIFSPNSSYSLPSTPMSGSRDFSPPPSPTILKPLKSHLIHLLPPPPTSPDALIGRQKLVKSIDSFLLNFSYPLTPSLSDDLERPTLYVLPSPVLGEVVPTPPDTSRWNMADLLLCGVLDYTEPVSSMASSKSQGHNQGEFGERILPPPRAWISGPSDIIISSSDPNSFFLRQASQSTTLSVPTAVHAKQQTHDTNWNSTSASDEMSSGFEYTPPPTPPTDNGVTRAFERPVKVFGNEVPMKVPSRVANWRSPIRIRTQRSNSMPGSSRPERSPTPAMPMQIPSSPVTGLSTEIDLGPAPVLAKDRPRASRLQTERYRASTPRAVWERTLRVPWIERTRGAVVGKRQSGLPTPPDSDQSSESTNGVGRKKKNRISEFFHFRSDIGNSAQTRQGEVDESGEEQGRKDNVLKKEGRKVTEEAAAAKTPIMRKRMSVWNLWGDPR
jgi:hypothetical protein